jgi:membrane protease YdiL (CAAX protease family)
VSTIKITHPERQPARKVTRFRQPQPAAPEDGLGPIRRSRLSGHDREVIDRARRLNTLGWMDHSVWLSLWSLVVSTIVALFGVGLGVSSVVLNSMPALVAQANPNLVLATVGAAFAVALPAGAVAYGVTRASHRTPIRRGRGLHMVPYALGVAVCVTLAAVAITRTWSLPTAAVRPDSANQVRQLVVDRQIVPGTVYEDPAASNLYFEVTIGAWIVTPITSSKTESIYAQVLNVAGSQPVAQRSMVAKAIGLQETGDLRGRVDALWGFAGLLCVVAAGVGALQRKRWNAPILVPALDDESVRDVLAADRARAWHISAPSSADVSPAEDTS